MLNSSLGNIKDIRAFMCAPYRSILAASQPRSQPSTSVRDLLFLICAHVLQIGERRLHVTIAQDGPRFQKSAPRDFDQPRTPHGMSGMMNAYPPTFPMSVPHRFPVPVGLLWRLRPLCLVAEG